MISICLPESYDELAAAYAAQSVALKIATNLCNAAVAAEDARNAIIQGRLGDGQELTAAIFEEIVLTNNEAQALLAAAVREYRALTEGEGKL